jgi:CrcB protein
MIQTVLQVALGGAIGSVARYFVNINAARLIGPQFPWGTVIVNVVGSFLMGLIIVVLLHKDAMRFAPFLMTGILGGFTTFSAFSLDSWKIWSDYSIYVALLYALGTVIVSFLALVVGIFVARSVWT